MDLQIDFRKATIDDNLEEISELLYLTDEYIYPYWFGNLENCKKELPELIIQEKFFFNVNNLYIGIDQSNGKIVGLVCIVDKNVDLSYDYSELIKHNDRYEFTINNYIKGLIDEVKEADFAYISNVCVSPLYRGKHIGSMMIKNIIEIYKKSVFDEIVLDVLADNPGAIKLYQNMGFEQFTETFKGFNDPNKEKPDVFSMEVKIPNEDDTG